MQKTQLFEPMRNVFGDKLMWILSNKEVLKQLILFEAQQNKTRKTNQNKTLEYLKIFFSAFQNENILYWKFYVNFLNEK